MKRIYMDHSSTTPLHQDVLNAMLPFMKSNFGNPSSIHWGGRDVREYIDEAREQVAKLVNASRSEIIFTGGGSESINLAIKGVAQALKEKGNHIVTTSVEHQSVLHTCQYLEGVGYEVTYLPVNKEGMIDLDELVDAIKEKTVLISVMYVNNETGNIFPVEEIGGIAKEKGVVFHTDSVQAVGKMEVDVEALKVDLLSISGHKFYGPKGIGCLYVRTGTELVPLIHGGHQERGRRAGTENAPSIVGMGISCEITHKNILSHASCLKEMGKKLYDGIIKNIDHVTLNGHGEKRIQSILNLSFQGVDGQSLLMNLDLEGIAVSTGSACSSGSVSPSHVLMAMGVSKNKAQSALRFSLGRNNTEEEIEYTIDILKSIVDRIRSISFP